MNELAVTTYLHVDSNVQSPDRARLMVSVRVNGEEVGELTVLSGPIEDVIEYANGRMSLTELNLKWGMKK